MTYYYTAFIVIVPSTDFYKFTSASTCGTYGALYDNAFSPTSINSNLITSGTGVGYNPQFKFEAHLRANKIYMLVASTSSPKTIGRYTIIVSGSEKVGLGTTVITTTTTTTSKRTTSTTSQAIIWSTNPPTTFGQTTSQIVVWSTTIPIATRSTTTPGTSRYTTKRTTKRSTTYSSIESGKSIYTSANLTYF